MTLALTLVASYDPGWLRVAEYLVEADIASGRRSLVLDITPNSVAPADNYHRGTLKFAGLQFPGYDIAERMQARGAEFVSIEDVAVAGASITDQTLSLLDIAVDSALGTYLRTDRPNLKRRKVSKLASRLRTDGIHVYRAVATLIQMHDVGSINVPNGRFPRQRMAAQAAREANVLVNYYEKGETADHCFFQTYSPHERVVSQNDVPRVLAGKDQAQLNDIADTWLAQRTPSDNANNQFALNWKAGLPPEFTDLVEGRKVAGFFTSSTDEFMFLGPEWHIQKWDDQYEAFDELLNRYEQAGYLCYLRVHPNLSTKAHDSFLRERRKLHALAAKHPNLIVFNHDEPISSYALVGVSDMVVVWYSTLGLEASARGVPVLSCATSRYGMIADVKEVLSREDLNEAGIDPWKVDVTGAKKFIAYLVLRDQALGEPGAPYVDWELSNPPFAAKIAALLVSGGAPTAQDALIGAVDTWRHRGLGFNLGVLQSKFRTLSTTRR